MNNTIERLKHEGKLREQTVGFVQVEGLLEDALKDIREAKMILGMSDRGVFLLAYQAMLKAGRALLFLENLRPADGAQHKTVIQVCEEILGKPFKTLAEQFETMRRKRHQLTYEYGSLLSHSEVKAALMDAEKWIRVIAEKAKVSNPQFKLPLDEVS